MIKKFEAYYDIKFEAGDYIKTHYWLQSVKGSSNYNKFKVIRVRNSKIANYVFLYVVNIYGEEFQLTHKDVSRKLKKKEIEQFELEAQRIKYNL